MKKHRLLIVAVIAASVLAAFSLGTILAKGAPNRIGDSGSLLCVDSRGCSIRSNLNAQDIPMQWLNEINELSPNVPIVLGDSKGGHAASGW
jgi:hypothetical protein